MAKVNVDNILERVNTILGERNDDEALSIIEDIRDSMTPDGVDWEAKCTEIENTWREKYRKAFFSDVKDEPDDHKDPDTFGIKDLFKGGI